MLLLRRHLLPLFRAASPLRSPIYLRSCALLSTSSSDSPFSLEDNPVAACSLAPTQAPKDSNTKAFEELSRSRLNSASNPDAVLALLSSFGLSRADIDAVVAADPLLLRSPTEDIGPRLLDLRDRLGLSGPQVFRFLLVGSRALRRGDVGPRIEFFVTFLGSFERLLVIMKNNNRILSADLEMVVKTNITLLHQCGLDVRDIAKLCSQKGRLLTFSPERVKEFVLRAEELGVPRSSKMFFHAVSAVACSNKEKVAAKLKFLKSTLGCSESEVAILVSKLPSILGIPEETLLRKIQFLTKEVGVEPKHIIERPALLGYSLEKRLVPRHCVMKMLSAKGLISNISFSSLAYRGEKKFRLKFIDCHADSVPGLAGYYATACAGAVLPEVQLSS